MFVIFLFVNNLVVSPLNYIGGKYRILPQILPLFPKKINTFVDLFCGGCNVGINVNAKKIIFNDNLVHLIDLYKTIQVKSEEEILAYIEKRIKQYDLSLSNKEGYIKLRNQYNKEQTTLDLFVLTAFSFNHQIRFNNSHEFNTPFGRERSSFNPRMKSNLLRFISTIKSKDIEFSALNYDDFDFSNLKNTDFVYCDPPYLITVGTYNDGKRGFTGWNQNEEFKLLSILDDLNANNISFALSNVFEHKGRINNILKSWVKDRQYNVSHITRNYSNSSYHTKDRDKNSTIEVLITNYQPRLNI